MGPSHRGHFHDREVNPHLKLFKVVRQSFKHVSSVNMGTGVSGALRCHPGRHHGCHILVAYSVGAVSNYAHIRVRLKLMVTSNGVLPQVGGKVDVACPIAPHLAVYELSHAVLCAAKSQKQSSSYDCCIYGHSSAQDVEAALNRILFSPSVRDLVASSS